MTTGFAFSFVGLLNSLFPADAERDNQLSDEAVAFCAEQDLRAYMPWARFYKGLALSRNGCPDEGLRLMQEGMVAAEQIKMQIARCMHFGHMADIYRSTGDFDAALELLAKALDLADSSGERVFEAELYRLRAAVLLDAGRLEDAERTLEKALAITRQDNARMWELRAAKMLAGIWRERGLSARALSLLESVYNRFDEGFTAPDLIAAWDLVRDLRLEVGKFPQGPDGL